MEMYQMEYQMKTAEYLVDSLRSSSFLASPIFIQQVLDYKCYN